MAERLFVIVIIGVVIYLMYRSSKQTGSSLFGGSGAPINNVINHWSHSFNRLSLSSDQFYKELEETLKEHQMPHAEIFRTTRKEAGIFSAARDYLRIKHGDIVFDVCASPFGKNFFISWWLYETTSTVRNVLKNTRFGNFLEQRAARRTFYQLDEEEMFRSLVHDCILETVSKVGQQKGYTLSLTETEKMYKIGAA